MEELNTNYIYIYIRSAEIKGCVLVDNFNSFFDRLRITCVVDGNVYAHEKDIQFMSRKNTKMYPKIGV